MWARILRRLRRGVNFFFRGCPYPGGNSTG